MRFTRRSLSTSAGLLALTAILFADTGGKPFSAAQKRWWAFQPVAQPAAPAVQNRAWIRNPIDAFVLAKLEGAGLKPNPPADNVTLLRRASLDLTGLPPTPEEVRALVDDTRPGAFSRAVERLLASARYGERWARHWLDLARYADSEGFKADETRPNIWRYRDYVIQSFNDDKPYDRFVREQIAGDELYPDDPAALVATGFNRHFPDESNARNLMQRRQEILNDVTDVVGYTFMGLTVACARCHDHKFDPILHKDYYRLQAFFANTRIEDKAALTKVDARREYQSQYDIWDAQTKDIRTSIDALIKPRTDSIAKDNFVRFPDEIQAAIKRPPAERTPIQWHMYYKAQSYFNISEEAGAAKLRGADAARYKELKTELAKFAHLKPADLPIAQAMIDNDTPAPTTHVLNGGNYDNRKEQVEPGFLTILNAPDPAPSLKRRSQLAAWLTDPANPLTARVMANRIWHHHFGRGIAGTPSDFGLMGERPTHRELLDYLAGSFVSRGWSVKQLHRLILNSSTWRQSSDFNKTSAAIDPDNKLLWRYNRHRLEGEAIRDSMLLVSGRLNTKMYGPGVFPPLPPGMTTRGGWKKNEDPSEAVRRSVYIFVRRNTRYPMMEAFDMPDTHESCARRSNTVTPTQSLELLNNELVLDWARSFATRADNSIDRAFELAFQRPPTPEERKLATEYLAKSPFVDLCHTLLISNEFMYVN